MKKELVKLIPKEDFAKIFLSDHITFADKQEILLGWDPGIEIPEDITTSQKLLDYVYDELYLKAIDKYHLDKSIKNIQKKKGGESRKDFIINTIQMKNEITYEELYKIVDEKWQYEAVGKSPRVRIKNTLKELLSKNKIAQDGNLIIWKGK